ncbi:MAG: lipoate--protein ligase family protein [Thermoguttaceae bacterium]
MRCLEITRPTAAENLALDEALLDEAEQADDPLETLRFWESPEPAVVVGRSSRINAEVRRDACRADGVPIFRRPSGGAAVVIGPGCLMYALVLSERLRPRLRQLDCVHEEVLGRMVEALATLVPGVRCDGTSDLALGTCKFSGNSVRRRRGHLLYHGTLLYDFPLPWIDRWLTMPPRTPSYREGRPHDRFVVNLPVSAEAIREALKKAWDAETPRDDWPADRTAQLVAEKYARSKWNEGPW